MSKKPHKKVIRVAIAGNPNTGKTSIFNSMTGKRHRVGNWPGVTVEKIEGDFTHGGYRVKVVDLPGIYGFSAYSLDERIARNFLLEHKVDLVINVVDATNLERNLYLNMEFQELGIPMIVALNMMDEMQAKKLAVDEGVLAKYLGTGIVKTVGREGKGTRELKDMIISSYEKGCRPGNIKFSYEEVVEEQVERIAGILKKKVDKTYAYSLRWLAIELLEHEEDIIEKFRKEKWFPRVREEVEISRRIITNYTGEEAGDFIISSKYSFLKGLAKEVIKKEKGKGKALPGRVQSRMELSDKIDRYVTGRILGVPVFLLVMFLIFSLTFAIGNPLADLLDFLIGALGSAAGDALAKAGAPAVLISLIRDGIIGGVGAVVVFLPNILILFLLIAILEDSGYMARAAFVMDKFMHLIGLHGKSFIPMIIGFGCNVPAIMATRTLETKKDRFITMMVIPFMSCSARMPIYILFTSAFFSKNQALVVWALYLSGIILGGITAKLANHRNYTSDVTIIFFEFVDVNISEFMNMSQEMLEENTIGMETVAIPPVSFGWVNATWNATFGSHLITIMMLGESQLPTQAGIFVEDVNESPVPALIGLGAVALLILLVAILPAVFERLRK